MRIFTALAALLFLATFAPPSLFAPPPIPAHPEVVFESLALNAGDPGQARLGRLAFLGGWAIRSNDPRFGGISAMHVGDRGVLAVSDAGSIMAFGLPDRQGSPLRIRPLLDGPGPHRRKANRDAEAMAVSGGKLWIGFEQRHAVWRYGRPSWRGEAGARPAAMRDWTNNQGAEAMVRLDDGRFLLFAEGGRRSDGTTEVLLFSGDPAEAGTAVVTLRYLAPEGYRITDAALLPGGRLLFLNRKAGLLDRFTAKLTLGSVDDVREGAVLTGKEIADLKPPVLVDNMEALSVTEEGRRTILWMISDDNFSPLQRTLLLKFALLD